MHFCKWAFVESVTLEQNRMIFTFNQSTITPGPFAARVLVTNLKTKHRYTWENAAFQTSNKPLTIGIPQITEQVAYEVELLIDGICGFANNFSPMEATF
ncbi:MAG: hypothetical protein ACLQVY_28650 [Limisphaerales bacterium]